MTAFRKDPIARLRRISSADLLGRINRIRRVDASGLTDAQISNRIGRLLDGHAHKPMMLKTNAVFRARKNPAGTHFESVKELWYPPAQVVAAGRFNHAHEPKFYSVGSMQAALWEVGAQEGDKITVLICGSRHSFANIICAQIGLHRYQGVPQDPRLPHADLRADHSFQQELKSEAVDRKWKLVDNFLADIVTSSALEVRDLYRMTRVIGEILSRIPNVSGIIYPSVATKLHAYCSVISCEAADQNFFPVEAWEFEILESDKFRDRGLKFDGRLLPVRVNRIGECISQTGEIFWSTEEPVLDVALGTFITRVNAARRRLG